MPPEGPALSAAEIELLKQWIDDAASWKSVEAENWPSATVQLWSFSLLRNRLCPQAASIIQSMPSCKFRLGSRRLRAVPRSPRRQLIRRLYLVMLGLPPAPSEVQQFEQDTSPDAWERWSIACVGQSALW